MDNAPEKSFPSSESNRTRRTSQSATPKALLIGLDLGTNTSCILSGEPDNDDFQVSKILPTVVGYVKEGIVNGILPTDADMLFGDEALENKLHLNLVWPLKDGVITNIRAMHDFSMHLRSLVDPKGDAEIRGVIGIPANASAQGRDAIRKAFTGVFERVLLIPEPFLAALGFRDESRLGQENYVDPVTNSLFIDIGAGTTDLCLVQGYFPGPDDQISFAMAGDYIDEKIRSGLDRQYPDLKLSMIQIREIKETHSYVGPSRRPMDIKVIVGGRGRTIEVADIIGEPCNDLLEEIYDQLTILIERAPSDGVADLLQNILMTGGGSRIKAIDTVLQERMVSDGYESPRVRTVGEDYKRFVGIGALKAARSARENQWQVLFH